MRDKFISKILLLTAGLLLTAALLPAQAPQRAPDNPAFVSYQKSRAQKSLSRESVAGHGLGLAPAPVDLSHLKGRKIAPKFSALPPSYDLRNSNKLTPVRDQSIYGTCWAFATYSSMESTLLPNEYRVFSVNNLVNNHGFDYGYDDGGTHLMSMAYLARWSGPVNEANDPYPNPGNSPSNLPAQKHVQDILVIPLRTNALDNDNIKNAVMTYGAMYISYYVNSANYNATNAAFYYSGTNAANHAVAIVGWDDDYPAGNFRHTPPGNGAFIVRNSWGAEWGEAGYFYCSYYDTIMGYDAIAVFNNAESTANYASIYQYDPLGWVTSYGYDSTNAWAVNVFTALSNDTIRAVGFYANDLNAGYEIYIYTGLADGDSPRGGTLATSQTGTFTYPGYYTVALNTSVSVTASQKFSVVIRLVNSTYTYPLVTEYALAGYSSQATASPGQGYISADGLSWSDVTSYESTASLCIKAYAGTGNVSAPTAPGAVGDYDGDAIYDPAIYQDSSGLWIVLLSGSGHYRLDLGAGWLGGVGYRAMSADYDGDRLTDPGVYKDAAGDWLIKMSGSGYSETGWTGFGGSGYTPLTADFDGDMKSDPAIYGRSNGVWAIKISSANYLTIVLAQVLGGEGYSAVVADYDGDGKSDPAIYRASNPSTGSGQAGEWQVKLSGSGYASVTVPGFGGAADTPIAADFDGDGLADLAVYQAANPSTASVNSPQAGWFDYAHHGSGQAGEWQLKLSASGYALVTLSGFGSAGYGAAYAADYDGDRKADPGLYQSSTGAWYFRMSGSGYAEVTYSSGYTP